MLVAKRSFKERGQLIMVGDIIDVPYASSIFRSRIGSHDILELTKDTKGLESWIAYLISRRKTPLDTRITDLLSVAQRKRLNIPEKIQETKEVDVPFTPKVEASSKKPATKTIKKSVTGKKVFGKPAE